MSQFFSAVLVLFSTVTSNRLNKKKGTTRALQTSTDTQSLRSLVNPQNHIKNKLKFLKNVLTLKGRQQ